LDGQIERSNNRRLGRHTHRQEICGGEMTEEILTYEEVLALRSEQVVRRPL
jgi:hypothetical protein